MLEPLALLHLFAPLVVTMNPQKHDRRPIPLPGWEYTASVAYFVTIYAHEKKCIFGEIVTGRMFLNEWGKIVREEWLRSEETRQEIFLDTYVIMPNHFHAVVVISRPISQLPVTWPGLEVSMQRHVRRTTLRVERPCRRKSRTLGFLIAGFTSSVTSEVNRRRGTTGGKVWQHNYRGRILRSRREYNSARKHIRDNPALWFSDQNHPNHL